MNELRWHAIALQPCGFKQRIAPIVNLVHIVPIPSSSRVTASGTSPYCSCGFALVVPARGGSRCLRGLQENFGDCKTLGNGLSELRIDWGPGYRVYYAMIGGVCVLLLCDGDKRKQSADIERASGYLRDYKERMKSA